MPVVVDAMVTITCSHDDDSPAINVANPSVPGPSPVESTIMVAKHHARVAMMLVPVVIPILAAERKG
ncbi:MAG: hypothetical protein ACJ74J_11205 [Blastocatellia bacterium]